MAPVRNIALILFLFAVAFAVPVQMQKPWMQEIPQGDAVDLGTIGPGQTITLEINPTVSSGGVHGIGGRYDLAWPHDLPEGWRGRISKLYGDPLQVAISAAPNASEGAYTAWVTVGDEEDAEQLNNLTFAVKLHLTRDVMDSEVAPLQVTTGAGQPARYYITITNKGTASDVFVVSTTGVKRWEFKRFVFLPAQSSKTIAYEIAEEAEESFTPTLEIVSTSSPIIREEHTVGLKVTANLFTDYKAMNNGILLFPIFESGIYALAGLISNFVG